MFRIRYEVSGEDRVEHRLRGMAARAVAPGPALKAVAVQMRRMQAELFDSAGHGAWPPLAASTVARKGHATILVDTEDLRDSLTEEGGAHVEEIRGDELVFGTSVGYAGFHQTGTSRMPARPPLIDPAAEGTLRGISKGIQAYLMGEERAAFGVPAYGIASLDPFGLT